MVGDKYLKWLKELKPRGIQSTIMFSFSVISISIMVILGALMYLRFSNAAREEMIQSTRKLMEQTGENLEDYLGSMRRISDADTIMPSRKMISPVKIQRFKRE